MTRKPWQTTFTVLALFAASVVLTGCPKKPAPQAGTGPGGGARPPVAGGRGGGGGGAATTGSAPGAGGAVGSAGAGAGAGAGGTGAGGAGSAGAGGAGGAAATGTTIPSLPSPKEFVESAALRDVYFNFDRYDVRAADKGRLDENAKGLRAN